MTTETWHEGMPARPCGGCTMCCKAPAIPEIGKPADLWCHNCEIGRGCRIYGTRPEPCRVFHCLWKIMPDFPEGLRPDRCRVIWQMTEDGATAVATTEYPKALETAAMQRLIGQFQQAGVRVVRNATRR